MKKLLLITSAALVGFVSQASAVLTVTPTGASDLATELRGLNKTDWAGAVGSGMLNTAAGMFMQDNTVDDGPVTIEAGTTVTVESIYKQANFVNTFGVIAAGPSAGPQLLTNLDVNQSFNITSDSSDTQELGFVADSTNINPVKSAGIVTSSMNNNVWTFVNAKSSRTHLLWLLEDFSVGSTGRDEDFNDFIVLGTISAVPEPSTIISLIAVGFLGFVTWRNRRKAKA